MSKRIFVHASSGLALAALLFMTACTQDDTGIAGTRKPRGGNSGTEALGASPYLSAVPVAKPKEGAISRDPNPNALPGKNVVNSGEPDEKVRAAIQRAGGSTEGDAATSAPDSGPVVQRLNPDADSPGNAR